MPQEILFLKRWEWCEETHRILSKSGLYHVKVHDYELLGVFFSSGRTKSTQMTLKKAASFYNEC